MGRPKKLDYEKVGRRKTYRGNDGNEKWNDDERMPWPEDYFEIQAKTAQSSMKKLYVRKPYP